MQQAATNKPQTRRTIRLLILAGLLLILIWLGIKAWRIGSAVQGLLEAQTEVEQLMAEGLFGIDPDTAEELMLGIRRDVVVLEQETAVFLPLTPYLTWLPKVGPLMPDAKPLLEMASAGTEAGAYAIRGLKPTLQLLQSDTPQKLPALVQTVAQAQPDLAQTAIAFDQFWLARQALTQEEALPAQIQPLLTQLDEWQPLAKDGLAFAQILPQLLGAEQPRRYLILAQNEDELRATGGFISGAGIMTIENGQILEMALQDAYQVDDWENKPYDAPPQPFQDYMGIYLFLFRDVNYWPDFPTTAQQAIELYSYGTDQPPADGVIAFDQIFLQYLLEVLGPIPISEADVTINARNLDEALREAWNPSSDDKRTEWIANRKDFLGVFASAMLQKLETDLTNVDPVWLAQQMHTAIEGKHLQLYMNDPYMAQVLDEVGWNGRLTSPPPHQDQLLIVDTNMGYNKVSRNVSTTSQYAVTLAPDGTAQAELTHTYTHQTPDTGEPCQQLEDAYTLSITYDDLASQCYWVYQRVYAPANSTLTQASAHTTPAEALITGQPIQTDGSPIAEQDGVTTFANYLLVPRGQSQQTHYSYTLPPVASQTNDVWAYTLNLKKQAGVEEHAYEIIVQLPEGTSFVEASHPTTTIQGNQIQFILRLTSDTVITISYQ